MSTTNVPLKILYDGTIRRAQFPVGEGFDYLGDIIANLYPTAPKSVNVSYVDDDGDEIQVSTDGDLVAAFHCFQLGGVGNALRLKVSKWEPTDCAPTKPVGDPKKPSISLLHSGVQARASFTATRTTASPVDSVDSDEDGFELVKSEVKQATPDEDPLVQDDEVLTTKDEVLAVEDEGPVALTDEFPDLSKSEMTTQFPDLMAEFPDLSKSGMTALQAALLPNFEGTDKATSNSGEKACEVVAAAATTKESAVAVATDENLMEEFPDLPFNEMAALQAALMPSFEDAGKSTSDSGKNAGEVVAAATKEAAAVATTDQKTATSDVSSETTEEKKSFAPSLCTVNPEVASPSSTDVPLRATSGGAFIYPDGTVEFGMGGDAVLLPDGQTVSCVLSYKGFPSVAAKNLLLKSGKWYYEAVVLTSGLMQIGWCDALFAGDSNNGEGVGDDVHSYAYDGFRQKTWHNQKTSNFGTRWNAGDVVCCAVDIDKGCMQFALNGDWGSREAFNTTFPHGLMPAASFAKGEKLCFNFGASGFVHAPPGTEYAAIHCAYGTDANHFENVGEQKPVPVITYMPSNASKNAAPAAAAATATDQLAALLLKENVRQALSRFLGHPDVAKSLQQIMVAFLTDPRTVNMVMTSQVEVLMPLFLQLVSEEPALMGLLPNILGMMSGIMKQPPSVEKPRVHDGGRAHHRGNGGRHGHHGHRGHHGKGNMFGPKPRCPFGNLGPCRSENPVASASPFVAAMDAAFGMTAGSGEKAAEACLKRRCGLRGAHKFKNSPPKCPSTSVSTGSLAPARGDVNIPDLVAAAAAASEPQKPRCKFIEQTTFDVETGNIVLLSCLRPGQRIAHTWTMVNPADISWPMGCVVKRVQGDDIIKTSEFGFNAEVTAHQSIHITVEAVAPTARGRYVDYWRVHDKANKPFGDRIWLDMTVV